MPSNFVTAMLKGGTNSFALKGADATLGTLQTFYDGKRPKGYQPMKLQGAVVLGTGGDNTAASKGVFFEGCIMQNYTTNSADDSPQADIINAKYDTFPPAAEPCDILATAGNPCVAAYSTTRALYAKFSGPLYQVTRSDGMTHDIVPIYPGGAAFAANQDTFCRNSECFVSILYDQSPQGNHLTPSGQLLNSTGLPMFAGHTPWLRQNGVYGLYFNAGFGHKREVANGLALGVAAETYYAVVGANNYSSSCCFEFANGNSGTNLQGIYFGSNNSTGFGSGAGPWTMLAEQGTLYSGNTQYNPNLYPVQFTDFVTSVVKGNQNNFAIKTGNAVYGKLTLGYEGPRATAAPVLPSSVSLGNVAFSDTGVGSFFEGYIASGYTSDETDNAVQANIVAVSYTLHDNCCPPIPAADLQHRGTA